MFEFLCKTKNNILTDAENKKLYKMLYHKISNLTRLTEIEIYTIQLLDNNEQFKLIQLLNDCTHCVLSYTK